MPYVGAVMDPPIRDADSPSVAPGLGSGSQRPAAGAVCDTTSLHPMLGVDERESGVTCRLGLTLLCSTSSLQCGVVVQKPVLWVSRSPP